LAVKFTMSLSPTAKPISRFPITNRKVLVRMQAKLDVYGLNCNIPPGGEFTAQASLCPAYTLPEKV